MTKKLTFKEKQALKRTEEKKSQGLIVQNDVADVLNNAAGEITKTVSFKELEDSKKELEEIKAVVLQQKKEQDRLEAEKKKIEASLEMNLQLIEDMKQVGESGGGIAEIGMDQIEPHPYNSTIYKSRIDNDFEESIARNGILDPIVVCRGVDKKYRSLSGHRRLEAAAKERVQVLYEEAHGVTLFYVPIIDLGEIDEEEQLLRLVEYNRQREKTWSEKMMEAETLQGAYSRGAQIRKLAALTQFSTVPEKVPARGDTRDLVGQEVFNQSGKQYDKYRKLIEIVKEKHGENWRQSDEIIKIDSGKTKPTALLKLLTEGDVPKKESWSKGITLEDAEVFARQYRLPIFKYEDLEKEELKLLAKLYGHYQNRVLKRLGSM